MGPSGLGRLHSKAKIRYGPCRVGRTWGDVEGKRRQTFLALEMHQQRPGG